MTTKENQKTKPHLLWWFDKKTNKNLPAGVAFYDEKFGEFRLKLDIHPETTYYLKPVSSQSDEILFRAEVVIKKDGKYLHRKVIGEGTSSRESQGDVFVELGPYSKLLVMGMN